MFSLSSIKPPAVQAYTHYKLNSPILAWRFLSAEPYFSNGKE
jgi:hypothetical protein